MSGNDSSVTRGLKTNLIVDSTGQRQIELSIGDQVIHLSLSATKKLGEIMLAWGTMAERVSLNECQTCKGTGIRTLPPISPGGAATLAPCLCLRGEVWRLIGQTETPEQLVGLLKWVRLR